VPAILSREVSRVLVVDDEPEVRKGHSWILEDASFEPVEEDGPLDVTVDGYALRAIENAQAALCDQRLGVKGNYAPYLGSQLIKEWYGHQFPAVLCTRYEDEVMNEIRSLRRWIPVLLTPDELTDDADVFIRACEECIYEFDVGFRPHRKPWRAQVVVTDLDKHHAWFEVPAWQHSARIRLRLADLPREISAVLDLDFRLFARVNLGAERNADLYFDDWELPR
jgi:CheY-like chemotaxis protein